MLFEHCVSVIFHLHLSYVFIPDVRSSSRPSSARSRRSSLANKISEPSGLQVHHSNNDLSAAPICRVTAAGHYRSVIIIVKII